MEWNWNIFGSLGQWAGATATLLAVITALNQRKPKIKIRVRKDGQYLCDPKTLKPIKHCGSTIVIITNIGMLPVDIISVGYRFPHAFYTTSEDRLKSLPKHLGPGEHIAIEFDLSSNKYAETIDKLKIFYALDSSGEEYYQQASPYEKILRSLWWHVCKYLPKYYKHINR
ncbi:hypothetical protein [Desulforamulus reducens]|uniref:hypothetical protein n=1 Tax=Desulforamulus reducens TaxID=59610 RepID=UPI00059E5D69|nr:hypothetical protein [Desulforamulus reducens]